MSLMLVGVTSVPSSIATGSIGFSTEHIGDIQDIQDTRGIQGTQGTPDMLDILRFHLVQRTLT